MTRLPEYQEPEDHVLLVSDLIEQLFDIDKLITSYRELDADPLDIKQYDLLKIEKLNALNSILDTYKLEIVSKSTAA